MHLIYYLLFLPVLPILVALMPEVPSVDTGVMDRMAVSRRFFLFRLPISPNLL